MFKIIYSIAIKFYLFAIHLAALFNNKAKLWVKGRKNLLKNIPAKELKSSKNIWFHVASVGEFEQARPLIEKIKEKYPQYKIILSFFSPSGYELRKNYEKADFITYLPIDTRKNATNFIQAVNPEIVFFVKYEFWYFFLSELHKKGIKTFLISAIFRKNQIFFKKYAKNYSKLLTFFTHIFVQNSQSQQLLNAKKINNVTVVGDTRFDRVIEIAEKRKNLHIFEQFTENTFCIVAGSTWQPDEDLLIKFINTHKDIKFIIAPHEINNAHIEKLTIKIEQKSLIYSKINQQKLSDYQVIIIDTIGLLSQLYRFGKIAYVGGGFGSGIHNIIEAAVYGCPVIFGTNYQKFKEATDLISLNASFSIKNYNELKEILEKLIFDKNLLQECSSTAQQYVYRNKGATEKIINSIFKL